MKESMVRANLELDGRIDGVNEHTWCEEACRNRVQAAVRRYAGLPALKQPRENQYEYWGKILETSWERSSALTCIPLESASSFGVHGGSREAYQCATKLSCASPK